MSHPLRIAIASSGLGHVARGVESWADDLATTLDALGEDVILCKGAGIATRPFERVIPCWTREDPATLRLLRYLPRRLSWRIGLGTGYAIEQTTFAIKLLRLLRRERADILHVQDPQVGAIAQRARRLGLIPTRTILAHGTEEPPAFLRRIQYLQHLAPWHMEQIREAGAWRPSWTAIPNFIDTDRFIPGRSEAMRAELGIPSTALVVLCVAAIRRDHKRIDHLIQEMVRLRIARPDLPVWLIVAGGWETDTDELVAEGQQSLGDRVRFLIRFPRARIPELYRAANVFVLASLFEMLAIVLLEATASGLPCLVHQHPVMEWVIGPGGRTIDMRQPGILAFTLEDLLTRPDKLQSLGIAGRRHCLENFAKEYVVGRILEYYEHVMGR